ncbi:MAG: DUF4397 domain-containing protein [Clostridium sp.]|nr:DUF4397 domain-containing protein [Clostridium sp.]
MPENPTSMPEPSGENTAEVVAGKNDANVTETPAEPLGGVFVYPGDDDLAGIPVPPIASPGGRPVYPGDDDLAGIPTTPVAPSGGRPVYPDNTIGRPGFPTISFPITYPTVSGGNYYSRVRFLNASTSGRTLDVYIDGRNIFSGSEFATISSYIRVTDGFHTVTVRRTNGQIYYQQTIAFVSGERLTMVILDTVSGVSLTRVSDMGCTNVPAGYGCLRVANMSYAGSSYDVRTFNNQTAFAGIGYKEVTSYKQTSSGTYTFFVTGSQYAVSALGELPVLVLSSIVGVSCPTCTVPNPLLTFNVNVRAGRAYTCYIIGNPWSGLFRVYVLED